MSQNFDMEIYRQCLHEQQELERERRIQSNGLSLITGLAVGALVVLGLQAIQRDQRKSEQRRLGK